MTKLKRGYIEGFTPFEVGEIVEVVGKQEGIGDCMWVEDMDKLVGKGPVPVQSVARTGNPVLGIPGWRVGLSYPACCVWRVSDG